MEGFYTVRLFHAVLEYGIDDRGFSFVDCSYLLNYIYDNYSCFLFV